MEVIFFVFIIYVIIKKYSVKTIDVLNAMLVKQQYANVRNIHRTNTLELIAGDKNGENFLFAVKNTIDNFYSNDVIEIERVAKLNHFHNVILVTSYSEVTSEKARLKIQELGYKVWNTAILKSIGNSTSGIKSVQVTTTTTTSYTNKAQSSNDDPIQYNTKSSWFKNLFKGPDRL